MTLKEIRGLAAIPSGHMFPRILTVRFTSDDLGESLSIADEAAGIMFEVPFEEVEKIIKQERAKRRSK